MAREHLLGKLHVFKKREAVHVRATPQVAGLERDVLVDRHTLVVCRHDRHTGSMNIRSADEVQDVLIVPVVKERLVLVALIHSIVVRVVLVNLVDTSLQRLLELGWRALGGWARGVARWRIWGGMGGAGERAAYARACLVFDASDRHLDSRLAFARLNEAPPAPAPLGWRAAIFSCFFSRWRLPLPVRST